MSSNILKFPDQPGVAVAARGQPKVERPPKVMFSYGELMYVLDRLDAEAADYSGLTISTWEGELRSALFRMAQRKLELQG